MAAQPRRRLLTADGVEIQSPAANRHHAVAVGGAHVDGEIFGASAANVAKVWLNILRLADPVPNAPQAGWVEADLTDLPRFKHATVPGAQTTPLTGSSDNKAVAIPEMNDGTFGTPDVVYFVGRPMQEGREVSALHCIWFAFADAGLTGPGPAGDREADTATHKPPVVVVPDNADQMTVQAFGTWRHFPPQGGNDADASDADGIDPQIDLQLPGYRDGKYRPESINKVMIRVNKLIGMWVDVDEVPVGSYFALGKGPTTINVPDDARKLCLAFHDGQRWHNNSGSVYTSISWVQTVNFYTRRRRQRASQPPPP